MHRGCAGSRGDGRSIYERMELVTGSRGAGCCGGIRNCVLFFQAHHAPAEGGDQKDHGDVARHMEVSKPSVCHAVATLRDGGFLTMDEDHFLHLTDVGREVAEKIYERHCFFTEQLIAAGVAPKTAEADACRIEHIISDESFDRLKEAAEQEQD